MDKWDEHRALQADPIDTYNEEGLECPVCHEVTSPDEPGYYDEGGYEWQCPSCGASLYVETYTTVGWAIEARKSK